MGVHWCKGPLILKQPGMHLPELALLLSAVGCFGRLERLLVDALERKIERRVANFPSLDVVSIDLRVRLTDVLCTGRSLVVREFNHGELCRGLALDWFGT